MPTNHDTDLVRKATSFTFAKSAFEEWKIISYMYIRIALQGVFIRLAQLISFTFIGRLDSSDILAGCGLGLTFVNVTGLSMAWGLTSGLQTLIPQAIGSNSGNHHQKQILIASYIQQSAFVIILFCIPLSLLQIFSGDIMLYIGQPSYLTGIITTYSTNLLPYLWFTPILLILQRTGRAFEYNTELLIIVIITCILSLPLNYLCLYTLNMSYIGSAWSMNITMILSVIFTIYMLCYKGHSYIFIPLRPFKLYVINGLYEYLRLAIPGMLTISLSWWTAEIIVIFAGYITDKTSVVLASFVIISQCNSIGRLLSVGMRSPIAIRVGKYIGYGSVKYAKRAAIIGILCVDSFVLIFITMIILIPRMDIPKIWSNDKNVIQLTQDLLIIMCIKQIIFNLYLSFSGIFNGLGYQKWIAVIISVCHYIIGIPLDIVFLFGFKWRNNYIYGSYIIWILVTFGYALGFIIEIIALITCINWEKAMQSSKMRIKRVTLTTKQAKSYGSI